MTCNRTVHPWAYVSVVLLVLFLWGNAFGDEDAAKSGKNGAKSAESVAARALDSVVVIKGSDRSGEERGLGTGFVVQADGLIVTNFHVVGEGRAFRVHFRDGTVYDPQAIVAADRRQDLAVVRISASDLPVLELGDSSALQPGQSLLAIGNPLGLEFSVSRGSVAALRDFDGREMIQVAMPLEPGSSGSPVMDLEGRVVGVLAMKSGTAMGFAVPVDTLRALLENPQPIAMSEWLTIGVLDDREWQTAFGGQWRQRAGRLVASGIGDGFAGRMLCLAQGPLPEGVLEVEVEVRLAEESGAAGLVFHSDGQHNHYGFYPTAGSIRLTRFEGPAVFQWSILRTVYSKAYRPGEWNRLKVRLNGSHITCSVNDVVSIEVHDDGLSAGRVGLVKFRAPGAEFRRFRFGTELAQARLAPDDRAKIEKLLESPGDEIDASQLQELAALGPGAAEFVRERAMLLRRQADRLESVARQVHERRITKRLVEILSAGEEVDASLFEAALLVAHLDNPELDVETYLLRLERMTNELKRRFGHGLQEEEMLETLIRYLFRELGFHGNFDASSHRSNSYINEVLDDREGLPITLAVIFVELGVRVGLPVSGAGIPSHFLAAYRLGEKKEQLIDVFAGGKRVTREEAETLSRSLLNDDHFRSASRRAIIARMLRNLLNVAESEGDDVSMARYLDVLVEIEEDPVYSRARRSMLRYRLGRLAAAAEDIDWIIERNPPDVDIRGLSEMRRSLRERGF